MEEVWKDIEGYENLYSVSNLGNVRSLRFSPPKNIYQTTTNCGYKKVALFKNGDSKNFCVHRLVAFAFVDGYKNGLEINHKDLDKTNNVFTNLEWVTRSENQKHQYKLYHPDYVKKKCPICGKEIHNSSNYCRKCSDILSRKTERPTKEELKSLLVDSNGNFTKISNMFGVTDNAVRKWCKLYELPIHSSDYKPEKIEKEKSIAYEWSVRQIDKNTNEILNTYESIKEAERITGITHISAASDPNNTKRKTAGGYIWQRVEKKIINK